MEVLLVKSDVFEEVMADVAQRYGTFDNGAARPRRRSRPHLVKQPRASGCLLPAFASNFL